jgi:hypothetical protein
VLGFGYYMVDIDLGVMFLNFPLPDLVQSFLGVDLRYYADDMSLEGNSLVHWARCWMGLKPSPFMAVRFYYLAEELCRGKRHQKNNPLRWDCIKLNLPGDPKLDPTLPRVMKWDSAINKIAGDVVAFVDDLRATGYLVEQAWAIAQQVASRLQYLGIQDAPQKRRPPVRIGGAWAGAVFETSDREVIQTVTQEKWDKARSQIGEVTEGFALIESGAANDFVKD